MKFRLLSDLHFEFGRYHTVQPLPYLPDEENMVVLLAGDIFPAFGYNMFPAYSANFFGFMDDITARHKHVVYVLGNHEHYDGDISYTAKLIKDKMREEYTNVTVLDNESISFDNIEIIGATLWTNYYDENAECMNACHFGMADYKYIQNSLGPQNPWHKMTICKIIPSDILPIHYASKKYIFDSIARCKEEGKRTIVLTHHAPSALSITPEYANDERNSGYVNDFTDLFFEGLGPDIWVHGHVHSCHDYTLGGTRVMTNPHGIGIENQKANKERELFFRDDFNFEVL